jgi:membrane protease YdiL (CAAX protease family)
MLPTCALLGVGLTCLHTGLPPLRVFTLLLFAPLTEEIVFRAGLHEALLRRGWAALQANLATALAFGAVHMAVQFDPGAWAVALPALLMGALYQRTRRVWPCVVLHAVMNAAWLGRGLASTLLAGQA